MNITDPVPIPGARFAKLIRGGKPNEVPMTHLIRERDGSISVVLYWVPTGIEFLATNGKDSD